MNVIKMEVKRGDYKIKNIKNKKVTKLEQN